jgi:hypothetical protein
MTSGSTSERPTTDVMRGLLVVGLALQVAACITVVLQFPRTRLEPGEVVEAGDRTLMLVGILGFGLGGVMSLTAVVAFGVLLGMRAYAQN